MYQTSPVWKSKHSKVDFRYKMDSAVSRDFALARNSVLPSLPLHLRAVGKGIFISVLSLNPLWWPHLSHQPLTSRLNLKFLFSFPSVRRVKFCLICRKSLVTAVGNVERISATLIPPQAPFLGWNCTPWNSNACIYCLACILLRNSRSSRELSWCLL